MLDVGALALRLPGSPRESILPLILTLSHPVSSAAIGWCCLTYPMWIPVVCMSVLWCWPGASIYGVWVKWRLGKQLKSRNKWKLQTLSMILGGDCQGHSHGASVYMAIDVGSEGEKGVAPLH